MIPPIARLRREPLVWFLLAGLMLFALHGLVVPEEDEASHYISIDRAQLLEFMQLRARSFNETGATARLEQMSPDQVAATVEDLAKEEVLYREALRLGLDQNDYVMRRRLVQSLEYIADDSASDVAAPDTAELKNYYEAHRARYVDVPSISFSHIFLSAEQHGWDGAERLARVAQHTPDANTGDRFLYMKTYAERTPELIASQFGDDFSRNLFALKPQSGRWQGPLRSQYGYHLVNVVERRDGRQLPFDEAKAIVAEDAKRDKAKQRHDAFIADILKQYTVDISADVKKLATPPQ